MGSGSYPPGEREFHGRMLAGQGPPRHPWELDQAGRAAARDRRRPGLRAGAPLARCWARSPIPGSDPTPSRSPGDRWTGPEYPAVEGPFIGLDPAHPRVRRCVGGRLGRGVGRSLGIMAIAIPIAIGEGLLERQAVARRKAQWHSDRGSRAVWREELQGPRGICAGSIRRSWVALRSLQRDDDG